MSCKKFLNNNKGFTLAEIIVATAVFVITFVGILLSYLSALELSELSRNSSTAVQAVKSRLEQIKYSPFNQILATYNGVSFTTNGLNGIGVSYVSSPSPNLLLITVSFCWRQKSGRVIGEDTNLNGVLNAGEDKPPTNGMIDSPVQVVNYVYNK